MNRDTIARTFPLIGGIAVRFSFTADCGLLAEWFPALPHFRGSPERRRFLEVYGAAKQTFLAGVEAEIGASLEALGTCGEPEWRASPAERVLRRKAERLSLTPSLNKSGRRASV
jgi:hypothetical protein